MSGSIDSADRDPLEVVEIDAEPVVEIIEYWATDALDGAEVVSLAPGPGAGQGGGAEVHRFVQPSPAARWVVAHSLGRRAVPLALYDDLGRLRCEWNATHPEINRMVIDFDVPIAGALDYL